MRPARSSYQTRPTCRRPVGNFTARALAISVACSGPGSLNRFSASLSGVSPADRGRWSNDIYFRGLVAAEIGDQTGTSDGIWPNTKLLTRAVSISKALRQVHRAPKSKAPEISTRHRLKKIRDVWDDFQASRTRDAVYGYLEAVFAIVEHYKVRRNANCLPQVERWNLGSARAAETDLSRVLEKSHQVECRSSRV